MLKRFSTEIHSEAGGIVLEDLGVDDAQEIQGRKWRKINKINVSRAQGHYPSYDCLHLFLAHHSLETVFSRGALAAGYHLAAENPYQDLEKSVVLSFKLGNQCLSLHILYSKHS